MLTLASGVLLLQDHYWHLLGIGSTQDAYNNMFPETQPALDAIWLLASDLRHKTTEGEIPEHKYTIFLSQVLYQAAAIAITIGQGNPDEASKEKINTFKWLLQHMQPRWRVAGESGYEILEGQSVANTPIKGVYLTILNFREAALISQTL